MLSKPLKQNTGGDLKPQSVPALLLNTPLPNCSVQRLFEIHRVAFHGQTVQASLPVPIKVLYALLNWFLFKGCPPYLYSLEMYELYEREYAIKIQWLIKNTVSYLKIDISATDHGYKRLQRVAVTNHSFS